MHVQGSESACCIPFSCTHAGNRHPITACATPSKQASKPSKICENKLSLDSTRSVVPDAIFNCTRLPALGDENRHSTIASREKNTFGQCETGDTTAGHNKKDTLTTAIHSSTSKEKQTANAASASCRP
jgi:hypothetical protein